MADENQRPGRAIVVGAGIGGLAAAVALRRIGWHVDVVERAPELGEVGAAVAIAPNAVKALRALGLGTRFEAVASALDGLRTLTPAGRRLTVIDSALLRERFGAGLYGVHRAALHRVLLDELGEDAVLTGRTATAVDESGTVVLDGPDGSTELGADLVVVADGVRSRLRQSLFPGYRGPVYAGYTVWRGLAPADAAAELGADRELAATWDWGSETWGRGSRFGRAPIADGRVYWYACLTVEAGAEIDAAELPARFARWHRPIPELIEATGADTLRGDVYYLPEPLPSFAKGRVVLLGDAAHAVTPDIGQGACLAIEDAVVLAHELARADVPRALRAYDAARRPRTQPIARMSGRMGRMLMHPSRALAAVRDTAASLVPGTIAMRSIGRIYEWNPPR